MTRQLRKIVAVLALILLAQALGCTAKAKEEQYIAWVFCSPQGSVNVRSKPDISGQKTGRMYLGDQIEVDSSTKRGGWLHSSDLPTDEGVGWISGSYISTDPVEIVSGEMRVDATGRVAAWEAMNCKKRAKWLKPGEYVKVYAISGIWAVTEAGFVKLDYLVGGAQ